MKNLIILALVILLLIVGYNAVVLYDTANKAVDTIESQNQTILDLSTELNSIKTEVFPVYEHLLQECENE